MLNLVNIIRTLPLQQPTLYSPLCGECIVIEVKDDLITIHNQNLSQTVELDKFGRFSGTGECLLFPSKDQRDWSTFVNMGPKLKPGDYVDTGSCFTVLRTAGDSVSHSNFTIDKKDLSIKFGDFQFLNTTIFSISDSYIQSQIHRTLRKSGYDLGENFELKKYSPLFKHGDLVKHKKTGKIHKILGYNTVREAYFTHYGLWFSENQYNLFEKVESKEIKSMNEEYDTEYIELGKLFIKDLASRLFCGVKMHSTSLDLTIDSFNGLEIDWDDIWNTDVYVDQFKLKLSDLKLYLIPIEALSSEKCEEFKKWFGFYPKELDQQIDLDFKLVEEIKQWYNLNHVDYNNLISLDLAIDCIYVYEDGRH